MPSGASAGQGGRVSHETRTREGRAFPSRKWHCASDSATDCCQLERAGNATVLRLCSRDLRPSVARSNPPRHASASALRGRTSRKWTTPLLRRHFLVRPVAITFLVLHSDSPSVIVLLVAVPTEADRLCGGSRPSGTAAAPLSYAIVKTHHTESPHESSSVLPEAEVARIREIVRSEFQRQLDAANQNLGPDPLWDVDQVAEYLNVSRRTVDTLIAAGELRPMRVGRQRRFDPKTIDAYLRSTVE